MNVVFTGPAFDSDGNSIVRADLTYACICKGGITVQDRVDGMTEALVASRSDTVKAKNAVLRGLKVMTYPQFITRFLDGVPISNKGKPNKYVDSVDQNLLVPDFSGKAALEELDKL